MFFDTHVHLNDSKFQHDLTEVIDNAITSGTTMMLNAGTNLITSQHSIAIASKYPQIYASVGIHPHCAKEMTDEQHWEQLERLAHQPKVVALGEMGLDYHYNYSEPEKQKEVFRRQLTMAKELKMPVIIHDREAHQDVLDILNSFKGEVIGVLHCFSGSWEMAKQCLELGYYISLAGPVTFPKAVKPKEVAKKVPLDRLLIETDCPYLTPQPYRGKRNSPAYVKYVAEEIAQLKGIEIAQVAEQTKINGKKIFNI